MLLLCISALAHVPHDTVEVVAAPSTLRTNHPWFLVSRPYAYDTLLRSDDGGYTWIFVGGPPTVSHLLGGGYLNDGTLVLAASDEWYWSTDDGDTWSSAATPRRVEAASVSGGNLLFATRDGIWQVAPGGAATEVASGSFVSVASGSTRRAAIDSTGAVWTSGTSAWTMRRQPGGHVVTATTASAAYVGTDVGTVYRWNRTRWATCGALPRVAGAEVDDVAQVRGDGDRVVVLTGWGGPFESTDACATWQDRSVPDAPSYDKDGGADDAADAYTSFYLDGDRMLVGGWSGLYLSDDSGVTWDEPQFFPPDLTRGLAFANGEDLGVYRGAYGAAVEVTFDGGATFERPGTGATSVNAQEVGVPIGGSDPDEAWALINHELWLTYDGGASWTTPTAPYRTLGNVDAVGSLDELYAFPSAGGGDSVLLSTDAGATWDIPSGLDAVFEGGVGRTAIRASTADGHDELCIGASSPSAIYCRRDGTSTWSVRYVGGDVGMIGLVAWPPDAPSRLVALDDDGFHQSDDDGATWVDTAVPDDGEVTAFGQADDGTLFIATLPGRVWRSDDGADTWTDLGVETTTVIYELAARPNFATNGDLLLGTHDGTWRIADADTATPTLEPWGTLERVDDSNGMFHCDDGCDAAQEHVGPASMRTETRWSPGLEAEIRLSGERVLVYGDSDGTGVVRLLVDGVEEATFGSTATAGIGLLAEVDGLVDGPHDVELIGVSGTGVRIDWLESRGIDTPFW
jgi:hypothetical protein